MDRFLPRLGDALIVLSAIVVGAAAVAVCLGAGLRSAPDSLALTPAASGSAAEGSRPVRALFLGGSVISGASRERGTPSLVHLATRQLGWELEGDGRTRAGFTVDGGPGMPRLTELRPSNTDAPRPDVVVLQGGEADVGEPAEELRAAVAGVLAELRAALGSARLVLVGPYSPMATPSPGLLAVRDTLEEVAREAGVPFLDPIASGWVSDADPEGLVNRGSRLPTAEGHAKIGPLLAAELSALGTVPLTA